MSESFNVIEHIKTHKALFIVIAVGLLLIELEIFAIAAMKSGRESRLQVLDGHDNVIYETDGTQLSDFNKYYFEKTFGPLKDYRLHLVSRERPFPFRAWFAAAIGVPVGIILLFAFVVRAYLTLVHGHTPSQAADGEGGQSVSATRFERLIKTVSQFNIFIIGALVFLAVIALWTLPNMLDRVGRLGIETLTQYKWVVLGIALVLLALVVWIIYLRYLLAKKSIEGQVEVDKYRLQLEMSAGPRHLPALEHRPEEDTPQLVHDVADDAGPE